MNVLQEIEAAEPFWVKAIPYAIVVLLVAFVCAACFTFGKRVEHQARVAEVATLNAAHAKVLADVDRTHREQLQAATDAARAADAKAVADMAAMDAKHTEEMNDAKTRAEHDIAAVRTGALRVRDRFACAGAAGPGGGAAAPGTPAGVGNAAGAGGLRSDDAEFLLSVGQRANQVKAQLSACQAIVVRDRQADASGASKP